MHTKHTLILRYIVGGGIGRGAEEGWVEEGRGKLSELEMRAICIVGACMPC